MYTDSYVHVSYYVNMNRMDIKNATDTFTGFSGFATIKVNLSNNQITISFLYYHLYKYYAKHADSG